MRFYVRFSLTLLSITFFAAAISLSDIPVQEISSSQFLYFVREVSESDSLSRRYYAQWPYSHVTRNQAQQTQILALRQLTDRVWSEKSTTLDIAEAIIYLQLYVLGEKNAYNPAYSLARTLIQSDPTSFYNRWILGELFIQSGQFDKGFAIFDSLYRYGGDVPQGFMVSYAYLASLAYLPLKSSSVNLSQSALSVGALPQEFFYVSPSEKKPRYSNWSVEYGDASQKTLTYLFEETYAFKPSLRFARPSLKVRTPRNRFNLPDTLAKDVPSDRFFWHPEYLAEHPTTYSIRLNRTPQRISAQEELYNLVNWKYDVIRTVELPKSLKGASVRCFMRNGGHASADLYAIAIIDRYTRGNSENFHSLTSNEVAPQKIKMFRYTITLTSKSAVEEKAEFLYQLMLEQFS